MGSCVVRHEEVTGVTEPTPTERSKFTTSKHWVLFNTDTLRIYHQSAPVAAIIHMAEALDANMSKWVFMYRSSGRRRLMNKDMMYIVLHNKYIYYIDVKPEDELHNIKSALIKFCEDNPGQLVE